MTVFNNRLWRRDGTLFEDSMKMLERIKNYTTFHKKEYDNNTRYLLFQCTDVERARMDVPATACYCRWRTTTMLSSVLTGSVVNVGRGFGCCGFLK